MGIFSISWSTRHWGIMEMFVYPGISPTASMVVNLIAGLPNIPSRLPESSDRHSVVPYSVYINNYFSSVPLFKELREIGCGACGTARPKQSGIPEPPAALKDHGRGIKWETLFTSKKDDVLCLAWQDNNMRH
jgi:hypothetical protein